MTIGSGPLQRAGGQGSLFARHPLLKVCAQHGLLGVGAALIVVVGLLAADAHGLRRLILSSPDGLLALVLLFGGLAITLASAAVGIAIMSLPGQDAPKDRGGRPFRAADDRSMADAIPVRVVARPRARPRRTAD